jgi:hypothetical protein
VSSRNISSRERSTGLLANPYPRVHEAGVDLRRVRWVRGDPEHPVGHLRFFNILEIPRYPRRLL